MITWTVTDKEADFILALLGQRPYQEVRQLIDKLLHQAQAPVDTPDA